MLNSNDLHSNLITDLSKMQSSKAVKIEREREGGNCICSKYIIGKWPISCNRVLLQLKLAFEHEAPMHSRNQEFSRFCFLKLHIQETDSRTELKAIKITKPFPIIKHWFILTIKHIWICIYEMTSEIRHSIIGLLVQLLLKAQYIPIETKNKATHFHIFSRSSAPTYQMHQVVETRWQQKLTLICWTYLWLKRAMPWPAQRSTNKNFLMPYLRRLWEMQAKETAAKHAWDATISSSKSFIWYFLQSPHLDNSRITTGSNTPININAVQERTKLKAEDWLKPRNVRNVSNPLRAWSRSVPWSWRRLRWWLLLLLWVGGRRGVWDGGRDSWSICKWVSAINFILQRRQTFIGKGGGGAAAVVVDVLIIRSKGWTNLFHYQCSNLLIMSSDINLRKEIYEYQNKEKFK